MLPAVQCLFIGECNVGKTTILKQATHQSIPTLPTVGVNMMTYTTNHLRLQCWDTSGQDKFKHVVRMFIKECPIIVYVFDATVCTSFEHILQWHRLLQYTDKTYFAICNKVDLLSAQPDKYRALIQEEFPDIHFVVSDAFNNAVDVMEAIVAVAGIDIPPVTHGTRECCTIV